MEYEVLKTLSNKEIFEKMLESGETKEAKHESKLTKYKYLNPQRNWTLFKRCCESSKYNLDYETTYLQLNDSRVIVVVATAGSGKTEAIVRKVDREIRLQGTNSKKICMLSFNRDAVGELKRRVSKVVSRNNIESSRFGISIEPLDYPHIRSLNSLTYNILEQFKTELHLASVNIITEDEFYQVASTAVKGICSDNNNCFEPTTNLIKSMVSLYSLMREEMQSIEHYEKSSFILGNRINVSIARAIMSSIESKLRIRGQLTHSDTCYLIVKHCEKHPEFIEKLNSIYDLIILDEAQDISECVLRLLKYMVGTNNRLWAVGDGDQSIYKFKGSRPNNCKLLLKDFPDAVQCNLSLNRRVPSNILEMAKLTLTSRTDRDEILPRALHQGGVVYNKTYTDKTAPIEAIAARLKDVDKPDLSNYVIAYRKNFSAFYVVNVLLEMGIPFQIKDQFRPGSDLLSVSLRGILNMLKSPGNVSAMVNSLYKVCNIKRRPPLEKLNEVLKKNYSYKDLKNQDIINDYYEEVLDVEDIEYFYEIPPEYLAPSNVEKYKSIMSTLEDLSDKLKSKKPLKDIVPVIYQIFCENYWYYTRKEKSFPEDLEAMILADLNRDMYYTEYLIMKSNQEDKIKKDTQRGFGVLLYTLHGLKGLEYDNVFIIELENNTMPLIREDIPYTEKEIEETINEELRLLYVGMTRAKKELTLFWSATNPSPFFELVNEYEGLDIHQTNNGCSLDLNLNLPSQSEQPIIQGLDFSLSNCLNSNETNTPLDITSDLDLDLTEESTNEESLNLDLTEEIPNSEILDLSLDLDSNLTEVPESKESDSLDLNIDVSSDLSLDLTEEQPVSTDKLDTKALSEKVFTEHEAKLESFVVDNDISEDDDIDSTDNKTIDEALKEFHTDDDFVGLKEGKALQSILNIICKEIKV